jgi:hypothetical protein
MAALLFSSLICSLALAQGAKQPASTTPAQPAASVPAEKQPPAPPPPAAAKQVPGAQQTATTPNSMGLTVGRAVIAKDLDENGPVDPGTEFTTDVKRLYCITQIKGAETPVQIEHRWYLNDNLVFSLPLPIKSVNWRTQSYKTILPDMTGNWKVVVVLMPKEEILTTLPFTVK